MNIFKKLFNFYIQSSIHVGLSVVSLLIIRLYEFNLPLDESFLFGIFFSTISGYNFVKYAAIAKLHHRSLTNQLKAIQVFSALSFLLGLFCLSRFSFSSLLLLLFLALINFLYAFPIFSKKKNLRNLPVLKIYIIAFVWSLTSSLLPVIEYNLSVDFQLILMMLQHFLIVLVLMIPFEIRDLQFDSHNLKTLPQYLGVKQTKILAYILIALIYLISLPVNQINNLYSVIICSLLFFAVLMAKMKQSHYYASFFVEAIPIISMLIFYILA